jgi:hypothetical protein
VVSAYLSWTYGFAQFASDASLLARRITSQSVFASKSRTERSLLERIVDGHWLGEEFAQRGEHSLEQLGHEDLIHGVAG